MPINNGFRHQIYTSDKPSVPYELLSPIAPVELDSDAYWESLASAGESLARAGISRIYLVHGTFAGTDMSGLIGELGRISPHWANVLRHQEKRLVDLLIGDWGNYDDAFEATLRNGINARLSNPIQVRRFSWSSENHHLGRADAAVRLMADLRAHSSPGTSGSAGSENDSTGVLLWGHSHAGNVFALMTNLLGGTVECRRAFFRAARSFYRIPNATTIDLPEWERIRKWLASPGNPLARLQLDFVTFGTPIRYGWDTDGYRRLLHVTNHRASSDFPEYRVPFPLSMDQTRMASTGDLFQQLFITGSNFPPNLIAWRSWIAERRLSRLIEAGQSHRRLWKNLKTGMRVANEGRTLLVDYSSGVEDDARAMLGHAVYTNRRWLPFHLDVVVSSLHREKVEKVGNGNTEKGGSEESRVETDPSRHHG